MDKEINLLNTIEDMKNKRVGLFRNLIRSNSGVSSKNFFLVCTTIVGVLMLVVLIAGFIIDMFYNHTITIDMHGASMYIGAVASLFASAGITKAWSDSSTHKYLAQHPEDYKDPKTQEEIDAEEPEEEIIPDEK